MKRRSTIVLSTLAASLMAFSGGLAPASAAPAPIGSASARVDSSDIALKAGAYGTRLKGGQVPAGSGMTAFSVIACSTKTDIERHNEVAAVNLPGAGTISGVATRNWTVKTKSGAMHAYSRSSTAEVVLADSPLGSLSIRGVTSLSHAWYDAKGFHTGTSTSIGKIVFTPPVGDPQEIDIPAPGQPVTVPGLATLYLGETHENSNSSAARAWATALHVKIIPTGTDLFVARSKAQALNGVKNGRFGGYSAGTEAEVLGGVLTSGRNPLSIMPCQGTKGETMSRADARLDLGGGLVVDGVSSSQWAKRFDHRSKAWERGAVAGVNLGNGALVIDALVAKATVIRKAGGGLVRSTKGTTIGTITANGQPQDLPIDQTIEIPGLAKLEPKVVEKLPGGLKVIALRITLLDGTGAVIDLGVAKTTIRR